MSIGTRIADALILRAQKTPYFHLDGYMNRWWLFRLWREGEHYAKVCGRIHEILRSDSDRHCHDHPWPYVSIILRGGYWEVREFPLTTDAERRRATRAARRATSSTVATLGPDLVLRTTTWHGPGSIIFRRANDRHRLVLRHFYESPQYGTSPTEVPSWSLFITGPKAQSWGFYTETGFVNWRKYPAAAENNNLQSKQAAE